MQRTRLRKDLAALRERYGPETEIGRRRTTIEEAAPARDIPLEAMIEREPVTVILSKRGWIRAMKGHGPLDTIKFKEGDALSLSFPAQTTDKLLLAAADGRVYTLAADKLPGARGFGEPVRLMVDLDGDTSIVGLFVSRADERILFASTSGKGFVARAGEIVAETRKGRQVVNLKPPARLAVARPIAADADHIAVVGDNRKLLVIPLAELPEMARGQGVTLQRYKDGGLADAIAFRLGEGLSWPMGGDSGRTRTETELSPWRGARGGAGRMPPRGFPQDNRFTG